MPDWDRTLPKCRELVRQVRKKQGGTCFLAGGDDRYCWNHPKDGKIAYLKLEWGHKVPLSQGGSSDLSNLILMCARCNNHIQTSRTLRQT
jgi:5-methylcytosine-specific restriction endonuclease McrA